MSDERMNNLIAALLDEADSAFSARDWQGAAEISRVILTIDSGNKTGIVYDAAARNAIELSEAAARNAFELSRELAPSPKSKPKRKSAIKSRKPAKSKINKKPSPQKVAKPKYVVPKITPNSSPLTAIGYTTTMPRDARHELLRQIGIPNIGAEEITKIIGEFITSREGASHDYSRAIAAWRDDIAYVNRVKQSA